jgi:hypothetical protein
MTDQKSSDPPPPPAVPAEPKEAGKSDKASPVHEHIGKQLRAMFDDVVGEPVPDRFRDLLDALEKKQAKG